MMGVQGGIVILDFGSQFTQLIARRIREAGVYSEILPYNTSQAEILKRKPTGIVLSGGPSSVYDKNSPVRNDISELVNLTPVLGICYGMHLLAQQLGGKVESSGHREYGRMPVQWEDQKRPGHDHWQTVWMSHGDLVTELPPGAVGLAKSQSGHWAAMKNEKTGRGYLALQFHPEVSHTENGTEIIRKFVFETCGAKVNWEGRQLLNHLVEEIKNKVGPKDHVLCGLSGGVDSTVTAVLLNHALGKSRVHNFLVDTGLMRHQEIESILAAYKEIDLDVTCINAEKEFLTALAAIDDPEKKRKTIGRVLIEVFESATKHTPCQFLAQGTLYPDVIESVSVHGQSVTIKSHHNVGGLPEKMNLKLVEPLRELFKDDVRALGKELGIKPELVNRHPFPGPGLAIRILGAVNKTDLDVLRKADHIFVDELRKAGLYEKIWQAFVARLAPTNEWEL